MKTEYERWLAKVDVKTDKESCWIWRGSKYRGGYGHFRRYLNGKWTMGKAHRFSYEYHYKKSIKEMEGFLVCHTCDNPSCVNPHHLFLGNTKDNIADKVKKGRQGKPKNPNHNNLSYDIVKQMRKIASESKLNYRQLGKLFDTSATQAYRIVNFKTWKEN